MIYFEVLRALLQAAIPVCITSFLLVWWSLKHDYFGSVSSIEDINQRVKQHSQASKRQKKNKEAQKKNRKNKKEIQALQHELDSTPVNRLNPVHNKWLAFGGGFYGVVALLTYAVIEMLEIRDFLANFDGFFALLSGFNVQLLVELFVNSIVNFVKAIAWPAYWLDAVRSGQPWVWLLAAYFGYWLGARLALRFHAAKLARKD